MGFFKVVPSVMLVCSFLPLVVFFENWAKKTQLRGKNEYTRKTEGTNLKNPY